MQFPHELYIGEVFFSPLLLDAALGLAAALLTAHLVNRFRLAHFFYHPPLVLIALAVLYTGLFSIVLLPG
jgi:hypothetical protein